MFGSAEGCSYFGKKESQGFCRFRDAPPAASTDQGGDHALKINPDRPIGAGQKGARF